MSSSETVRAAYEAFNARDFDAAAALVTGDFTMEVIATGETFNGPDGLRAFLQGWATAFPDAHVEVRSVVAEDDRATAEFVGRGRQTGPFPTPAGELPPTGRPLELRFVDAWELREGRLARMRTYFDAATLLGQLGVLPGEREAANKALARRWFAAMSEGDAATLVASCAPGARFHMGGRTQSFEEVGGVIAAFREGMPDLRFVVEDVVAEGDRVVTRWAAEGTHTGVLLGIPPTGRRVRMPATSVWRVVDGRLAEDWVNEDMYGLLQQVGAIPAPEQATA
ncbi:MAG TPA: ester cyclase family protein [Longimicrobiaceae bacterium]|nr:ester cyclase family protein [Longimicrobiaceae bacterium]